MLVEEMTRVVKKSMVGSIDPNRTGPLRSDPGDHKDRTGRSSDGRELLFIELGSVIDVNRCRYRSAFQGVVTRHSDCGLATAETNRRQAYRANLRPKNRRRSADLSSYHHG